VKGTACRRNQSKESALICIQEAMMLASNERRTGSDRRRSNVDSYSAIGLNRRWKTEQRSYVIDESFIYDSKTIESDDYFETLTNIPSEDSNEH
jgi:hypothetical protein